MNETTIAVLFVYAMYGIPALLAIIWFQTSRGKQWRREHGMLK